MVKRTGRRQMKGLGGGCSVWGDSGVGAWLVPVGPASGGVSCIGVCDVAIRKRGESNNGLGGRQGEWERVARWPPVLTQRAREGRAGYPLLHNVQRVMTRAVGGHLATCLVI